MNDLPDIPLLETEELWSQRAIDTPDEVLEEIQKLKERQLTLKTPTNKN